MRTLSAGTEVVVSFVLLNVTRTKGHLSNAGTLGIEDGVRTFVFENVFETTPEHVLRVQFAVYLNTTRLHSSTIV